MNFLFGLAIAVPSVAVIVALYFIIPAKVWALLPPSAFLWKSTAFLLFAGIMFLFVFFFTAMTYGPRLTVQTARMPSMPDRIKTEETPIQFIEDVDRIGQFNKRLYEKPIGHNLNLRQ